MSKDKVKPSFAAKRLFGMSGAAVLLHITGEVLDLRDKLPEPIDVFDHSGNFFGSIPIGLLVATTASATYAFRAERVTDKARKVITAAATSGALIINTLMESRWGQQALPLDFLPTNIPDVLDVAYGTIGAYAGASTMKIISAK